jgi:hypothetical protein
MTSKKLRHRCAVSWALMRTAAREAAHRRRYHNRFRRREAHFQVHGIDDQGLVVIRADRNREKVSRVFAYLKRRFAKEKGPSSGTGA